MQIMRSVRILAVALLALALPATSLAGVVISVAIAPPALPVYEQPPCPGDGYMWTPGYWAYGPDGYYWVPGTWVQPPSVGLLWTPGYWGWGGHAYVWHAGYWGPHVGFYGGVNYGFGYVGVGYAGGYWHSGHFFYNRSVNHITITNVHIYNKTVVNNVHVTRVSYNGGRGGIVMRPSHRDEVAMHERHFEATRMQINHEHGARDNREFRASVNHGHPGMGATARPGEFRSHGGVPAHNAGPAYHPAPNHAMNRPAPHPVNAGHAMGHPQSSPRNDHGNNGHTNYRPAPAAHNTSYHPSNEHGHGNAPHGQEHPQPQAHGHGHGHGH